MFSSKLSVAKGVVCLFRALACEIIPYFEHDLFRFFAFQRALKVMTLSLRLQICQHKSMQDD